jgi:hypothetical protein
MRGLGMPSLFFSWNTNADDRASSPLLFLLSTLTGFGSCLPGDLEASRIDPWRLVGNHGLVGREGAATRRQCLSC